jgi:CRP-like cAMP-binding protein
MTPLVKEKGELIMEYGDEGEYFYLILEGQVEILTPDPNRK